jgi:hypothetical protein
MVEYEVKCPSGAVYKLRTMNFLERNDLTKECTTYKETKNNAGEVEVVPNVDGILMIEKAFCMLIVEAPWLKKGDIITRESLKYIEAIDADMLSEGITEKNFLKKESN